MNVKEIEGIGPVYAEKLRAQGVVTTKGLLDVAANRKGRETLAEKIGVPASKVLEWVNRADLMRVKGVGKQYSDLLEAAGVDSPRELSNRRPDHLHKKLVEINAEKKLVRRPPTQVEVERWVEFAKSLHPVVMH